MADERHPEGKELAPDLNSREEGSQFSSKALVGTPSTNLAPQPGEVVVVPRMEALQDNLASVMAQQISELMYRQKSEPLSSDDRRELHKLIDSYSKLERAQRERAKLDRSADASDEELEAFLEEYAASKGWKVEK